MGIVDCVVPHTHAKPLGWLLELKDCTFTHCNGHSSSSGAITSYSTALLVAGCTFDSNGCRGIQLQQWSGAPMREML